MNAFEELVPNRRITDFMGSVMVEQLLDLAIAGADDFAPTSVGNGGGGTVSPYIRASLLLRDLGEWRSELETRFAAVLDDTVRELRLSDIVQRRSRD
ncbi:hypothetical protein K9B35_07505 [Sphingomonas sp. R647]|uniref:hypothetical protein n=1 Tax=Sphingomonas sp. R647 TaxID=2875233 RepID=UPI001CD51EB2|nr:hypothetical protein [Sphingomonas sp. R647]MCA1197808.1 hypothetical protein [Sphingomonas sp. R647]